MSHHLVVREQRPMALLEEPLEMEKLPALSMEPSRPEYHQEETTRDGQGRLTSVHVSLWIRSPNTIQKCQRKLRGEWM